MRCLPLLLVLAACQRGADDTGASDGVELVTSKSRLTLSDGLIDIRTTDGVLLLRDGFAGVQLDGVGEDDPWLRTDDASTVTVDEPSTGEDPLGVYERVVVVADVERGALTWTLSAYEAGFYTFGVELLANEPLVVSKSVGLRVEGPDGGVFLGDDPSTTRILENGAYTMFDFTAEVVPGDRPWNEGYATLAPGGFMGHSVSNWNHVVHDLDGGRSWVGGAITFDRSFPVANLSHLDSSSGEDDGRVGFSFVSYESAVLPNAITVPAGEVWRSETYYIDPTADDPLRGVEQYAQVAADNLGVVPWHRRKPGRRVPNGWNSWAGSASTGGYGTDINEQLLLDNADFMAAELRDWGMEWFQIDDGYEPVYGQWEWREDRFPNGPAWLSEQIRQRGLKPGLWMAPFTVHDGAEVLDEHPEWIAERTPLGQVVVGQQNILDLSNPEVQAYLRELARTVHEDWGFEWYKLDFGYLALFGEPAEGQTREQAWRASLQAVRDGLGEDTFFMIVGLMGLHYDIVDSGRTTLDNMPIFEGLPDTPLDDHLQQQGFKPTVRTAGRRWYLHDRLWVNHPDLLFYRTETEPGWEPLTESEAEMFASFVGLSGGIVKLGERLVEMDAHGVATTRRLLPIEGTAARPLDVFEREIPERWQAEVSGTPVGDYQLLGLFNWGDNIDLTESPYTALPSDGSRSYDVDLGVLGFDGPVVAYEFWTGDFREAEGSTTFDVPHHTAAVWALRPQPVEPAFVGWNRQISMGGTVLESSSFASDALTMNFEAVPGTELAPFVWEVAVYAPSGFTVSDVSTSGVSVSGLEWSVDGQVVSIRFEPDETGELELVVQF